jgi:glycosyltransferase involved in cell wall biosynthesis/uncharacterized SAM-binding protein YcdF (DUF218 family)
VLPACIRVTLSSESFSYLIASMNSVAVVIPAFNEAGTIRELVIRVRALCETVIVVDDGSTDGTAACLEGLDVVVIRHEKNLRKAAALWRGLQAAMANGADTLVTLDGDGQHRPEDLPVLLDAARRRPNTIVIGARRQQERKAPFARRLANRIADFWISWAAGHPIEDSQSGYRAYPAKLFEGLKPRIERRRGFVFESEILIEAARRSVTITSVGIPSIYELSFRRSHFRPLSDITAITLMVAGHLLRRGLFLAGLYRSFIEPRYRRFARQGFDSDALVALMVSLLVGVLTLGSSFLWLVYRVNRTAVRGLGDVPDADAVVVLGHRMENHGISRAYKLRLDRALQLYRNNPTIDLHIVGGQPAAGITEADAGAEYLISRGVDHKRLFRETVSNNTLQNLLKIRPMLRSYQRVTIVSSGYHLERVLTFASGMNMSLMACGAEHEYNFALGLPRSLIEGFLLHWYWAGRVLGHLTRNRRILEKLGQNS